MVCFVCLFLNSAWRTLSAIEMPKKERKKWPQDHPGLAVCELAVPSAQMGRVPAARKPDGVGLGESGQASGRI